VDPLVEYARYVLGEAERSTPATNSRRYHLPLLDVEDHSTDAGYIAACDRGLVKQRRDRPPHGAGIRLTLIDATAAGLPPPRAWWEEFYRPLDVESRLADQGLRGSYFHDNRLWQFYDAKTRRGVALMRRAGDYPPWEVSAPLRVFLHWIYAEAGLRMVHAATLGARGRGVLIAGRGGAGKSSTTLAGVAAGLDSVGDDYVLVEAGDDVRAHPVYAVAKQDASGFARLGLGRLVADPGPLNWQGKHEFGLALLGRPVQHLALTAILVPRVAHRARTEIVLASPREAMLALAPSGIFQMPGEWLSGSRFYADLIRRLPSFRIELGTDGREIAESIASFLDRQR
jgi:hypothetical protein